MKELHIFVSERGIRYNITDNNAIIDQGEYTLPGKELKSYEVKFDKE